MPIIRVTSLSEPGLEVYGSLTERQLKSFYDDLGGLFIAESPKVIKVALDAGYEPVSGLSGNLVGISINLCKSIQKELFINDAP